MRLCLCLLVAAFLSGHAKADLAEAFVEANNVVTQKSTGDSLLRQGRLVGVPKSLSNGNHKFYFGGTILNSSQAEWSGLAIESKVVTLGIRGRNLTMYQDTSRSFAMSSSVPTILLDEYPVVYETERYSFVDFSRGRASFRIDQTRYVAEVSAIEVVRSMSDGVSFDLGLNLVSTNQSTAEPEVSQSQESRIVEEGRVTLRIRYFLKEVIRHSRFQTREAPESVGYFLTDEVFPEGANRELPPERRTVRWNFSRPVVFTLSATFPDAYRSYAMQGVQAWNDILGRNAFEVRVGNGSESFANVDENVIYWDEDPASGASAALAQRQYDPVTGETFHAHIMVYGGQIEAQLRRMHALAALRNLTGNSGGTSANPVHDREHSRSHTISMGGQVFEASCKYEASEMIAGLAATIRDAGEMRQSLPFAELPFEEFFGKLIRVVVMHEVGHTLGLRHNFMGSVGFDAAHHVLTTSVMDYLPAEQLYAVDRIQAYDRIAIAKGYDLNVPERASTDIPPYCTDQQVPTMALCNRLDYGSDVIQFFAARVRSGISLALALDEPLAFDEVSGHALLTLRKFLTDGNSDDEHRQRVAALILGYLQMRYPEGSANKRLIVNHMKRGLLRLILDNHAAFSGIAEGQQQALLDFVEQDARTLNSPLDIEYRLAAVDSLQRIHSIQGLLRLNRLVSALQATVQAASDRSAPAVLMDREVLNRALRHSEHYFP